MPDDTAVTPGADTITYRTGADRAVLLIHGFGDTPQTLQDLATDLHAHGYDVRVPLLPGHGRTLATFNATSYTAWIDAARAELLAMRARYPWVALGGLSMGGALAVIAAAGVRDLPALVLFAPYLGMPMYARVGSRLLRRVHRPLHKPEPPSELSIRDPKERTKNLGFPVKTGRTLYELSQVVRLARRALPSVTAPTLIVQSVDDYRVKPAVAIKAFRRLGATRKRLMFTNGAGHILTVDYGKQELFNDVRAWLRGGPGTNPPQPDALSGIESAVGTAP